MDGITSAVSALAGVEMGREEEQTEVSTVKLHQMYSYISTKQLVESLICLFMLRQFHVKTEAV